MGIVTLFTSTATGINVSFCVSRNINTSASTLFVSSIGSVVVVVVVVEVLVAAVVVDVEVEA